MNTYRHIPGIENILVQVSSSPTQKILKVTNTKTGEVRVEFLEDTRLKFYHDIKARLIQELLR